MSGANILTFVAIAGTLGLFMGFLSLLLLWKRSAEPPAQFRELFLDFLERTEGERKLQSLEPDTGGSAFTLGVVSSAGSKYEADAGSTTGAALRIGEIRRMVSTGMCVREIAERMNMPRGEIDLILKLR